MNFEILTLFPAMFTGVLESSILKRARESGALATRVRDIRDYAPGKHRVCDDAPYGGGPGMVMKVEPIAAAIEAIEAESPAEPVTRVYLTPEGEPWSQRLAEEFATRGGTCVLLCGHYEGIDERARELFVDREVSLGDFVMTGGELAAMAIIDSVARLLPGVLGNPESAARESFASGHGGGALLDCPHYTRPDEFRGLRVPDELLSGHHALIDQWRLRKSLERTLRRRPELVTPGLAASLAKKDRKWLEEMRREVARDEPEQPVELSE